MREAFAMQKLLTCKSFSHFFNKKYWHIWDINVWNFNVLLTNEVVSFEQPGPELQIRGNIEDISKMIFLISQWTMKTLVVTPY